MSDKILESDIAIIGMGCRMPGGANTPDQFWDKVLSKKIDTIVDIPSSRPEWDIKKYYEPKTKLGKYYVKTGAFLEDSVIKNFDSEFFMTSAREADSLDPQHRILLQVTWEALENAGIAPSTLAKSNTEVHIGIHWDDYASERYYVQPARTINAYSTLANLRSLSAGRISYFFDLHGKSMQIDTACSSGLVGLVSAVKSLQNHETNLAIAGSVSLLLTPHMTIGFCQMGVLSKDGRCKTFSAAADGFSQGEGCNVIILKRLTDAVRGGDTVLAVIKGTAINHDGRSLTLTTPSSVAQQAMLKTAIHNAGICPTEIQYIETHGTGTSLGDYIEVSALANVLGQNRTDPLFLGSIKTNVGHLGATAGLAGLMKVVLSIQHNAIPANLHFHTPNPRLPLKNNLFEVPTELTHWNQSKKKIAGVSAFGMSGTNVHTIVEEFNTDLETQKQHNQIDLDKFGCYVFMLSAKTMPSLQNLVEKYVLFLRENIDASLANICYTAHVGRDHFKEYRLSLVVTSIEQLIDDLEKYVRDEIDALQVHVTSPSTSPSKKAFLFTGQGSQYFGMGFDLYTKYDVFRDAIHACAIILEQYPEYVDKPLIDILYFGKVPDQKIIHETRYTQVALFAFEYALTQLWMSWGIKPDAVMGHSVGEYVAACVAGVFSLEDGLKLVAARGFLINKLASGIPGGMLSMLADERSAQSIIKNYEEHVSIAAVNGPESIVVSGCVKVLAALEKQLVVEGVKAQRLTVSHAFHSPLMKPMLDEFLQVAQSVIYHKPSITLLSNVTNTPFIDDMLNAEYWVRHVIAPVRFYDSVGVIHKMHIEDFIEIGPKPVLTRLAYHCIPHENRHGKFLASIEEKKEIDVILNSLAHCYVEGAKVNWKEFYNNKIYKKIALPTYCFSETEHWVDLELGRNVRSDCVELFHPLLQTRIYAPGMEEGKIQFESTISPAELDYVSDHRAFGKIIYPASAYIEMILSGVKLAQADSDQTSLMLKDVSIEKAFDIDRAMVVQLIMTPEHEIGNITSPDSLSYRAEIYALHTYAKEAPRWNKHVSAKVASHSIESLNIKTQKFDVEHIKQKLSNVEDIKEFYRNLKDKGLDYGASLQNIKELFCNEHGEALGFIKINASSDGDKYISHPALLDTCFHVLLTNPPGQKDCLYLPIGYHEFTFLKDIPNEVYSYVAYEKSDNKEVLTATLYLLDLEGNVLAVLDGCKLRKTTHLNKVREKVDDRYLYEIDWQAASEHEELSAVKRKSQFETCLVISNDTHIEKYIRDKWDASYQKVTVLSPADINLWIESIEVDKEAYSTIIYKANSTTLAESYEDCKTLLSLVKYVRNHSMHSKIMCITKGCMTIECDREYTDTEKRETLNLEDSSFWNAPLWGFAKTLMLELDSPVICLDLDPHSTVEVDVDALFTEQLKNSNETQIAYRKGKRYVARLKEAEIDSLTPKVLSLSAYGLLNSLMMKPLQLETLKKNEVKVRVVASGVNFRDLLRVLGMMRTIEDPHNVKSVEELVFGYECAGIVMDVGENVNHVKEGDEVVVYSNRSLASHVIAPEELVVKKPGKLKFAEAATLPVAYITAMYGLIKCAQLKASDKVLIHNAAGGVGQAAVQLAKAIGAEIYATAHPNKWDFLTSLGIKHIYSSRNVDFMEQINADTNGVGVDVILNSLNGEFVDKSVALLKQGGRFVEIGKLNVWDAKKFNENRPDAHFYMFDLNDLEVSRIALLLHEIMAMINDEKVKPLPTQTFPIAQVEQAFRHIQHAKHIGKVALSFEEEVSNTPIARLEASYLITGGLGGLGLKIMEWLANKGAKHIVVTGRKKASEEASKLISNLTKRGIRIDAISADISNSEDVKKIIGMCPHLKGVIHAAGIIEDGLVANQSSDRFERVMAAKVDGTWHLHVHTQHLELDYFVCFSSVASLIGSVGQSNYAAANAFMDQLSHYRRRLGLPCIAINWGPWAEVGMAAPLTTRLHTQGYKTLTPDIGLEVLGNLIRLCALPQIAVLPMNWQVFLKRLTKTMPFFDQLNGAAPSEKNDTLLIDVIKSSEPHERMDAVEEHIKKYIRSVVGLSENTKLGMNVSVFDLGLDSLMAVELKNIIEKNLEKKLRSTLLFDFPTIKGLITYLSKEIPELSEIENGDIDMEPIAHVNNRVSTDIGVKIDEHVDFDELTHLIKTL